VRGVGQATEAAASFGTARRAAREQQQGRGNKRKNYEDGFPAAHESKDITPRRRSPHSAPPNCVLISEPLQFSPKRKHNGTDEKQKRGRVIPSDAFAEVEPREDDEYAERDDLLYDFQLVTREFSIADAIRRDLKAVFGERDEPAHQDYGQKRSLPVFQVAIPGDCHEDIGTDQKKNGFHSAKSYHVPVLILGWKPSFV
jgi:hypothetical protein